MFGERIKMLRTEKKLTMKDMSKEFKMSISAWNKYEKNEAEPTIGNLIKMSNFFEVSLDFLLCKSNIKNNNMVNNTYLPNEIYNEFQDYKLNNLPESLFFFVGLSEAFENYNNDIINEETMELLLIVIDEILLHNKTLHELKMKYSKFNDKVWKEHSITVGEIIKQLDEILYSIYKDYLITDK